MENLMLQAKHTSILSFMQGLNIKNSHLGLKITFLESKLVEVSNPKETRDPFDTSTQCHGGQVATAPPQVSYKEKQFPLLGFANSSC